ncbi:DUF4132 domain-containing protein [Actinomadura opuntiae]|uniref:DUF4132 domain-containing protein n=1 Tax=Actinomadura sp. OS1-43 TaxID=604315 RepID=UPI00255AD50E|nr:DUF4132 domain-containing protein [Actinomadura sp. OS1-43]MDL4814443.1 DUF4132 domain-containing protein [Actinomadura sp. OS1-43]
MTRDPHVEDAPDSALPALLVRPPWAGGIREPVVLKLKASREPTVVRWAPGQREKWLEAPYEYSLERLPEDTDWDELAAFFGGDQALELWKPRDWPSRSRFERLFVGLVMQAPREFGEKLLADERYWDAFTDFSNLGADRGAVARHEMAAYPLVMHQLKKKSWGVYPLAPFLDHAVAQGMIKSFDEHGSNPVQDGWFDLHGVDAVRLVIPDTLRKPGPKRERAEAVLRSVAERHGHDVIADAARHYGDEAVQAVSGLRTDPLDVYPDPLPDLPEGWDPERLPRILLRGRRQALSSSATRHLLTMLSISERWRPYPGVPLVTAALDPESLAEFAWALYEADRHPKLWAFPGVQYLLAEHGDDRTADRLAPIVERWSRAYVWAAGGQSALHLFGRLGTDSALRHLDRLANKANDEKWIRKYARKALESAAEERGLTQEQLADRLVPDLGLDADGSLTLDYGPRRFVVGFDEELKPFVTDQNGKPRKTLPKPGANDDGTLAPAAYQRFTDLKKQARTVTADQTKRLEAAMATGRTWAAEEFTALFLGHPLMRTIARRLVWSAGADAFRVAEDGTLADVRDDAFTLPGDARVALPHPLVLGEDAVRAWAAILADYEILQPFPQLGRPVHTLQDDERDGDRLRRFEGATVHFGRILGLTSRGWELGEKETGGFRRQVMRVTPDERHVMVAFEPGIRVFDPEEHAEQHIERVMLMTGRHSGKPFAFGELDPVTASEILTDLHRLTE